MREALDRAIEIRTSLPEGDPQGNAMDSWIAAGEIMTAQTEGQPQTLTPEQQLKATMQDTMAKLEQRNAELSGFLFGVFGAGETRAFVFGTPLTRQINQPDGTQKTVDEFLAVTLGGFKLAQIDQRGKDEELVKKRLIENVEERSRYLQREKLGYFGWGLTLDFAAGPNLSFMSNGTTYFTSTVKGARLIQTVDPEAVVQIVQRNIESAKEAQRQKAEVEVKPHLTVAQRLDEILQ